MMSKQISGILLVNKSKRKTSFSIVAELRKLLHVSKIGHAGTLDPIATGVMVMLIGKKFTKLSDLFLSHDKAYRAKIHFGIETDTLDTEGAVIAKSTYIPTIKELHTTLLQFQGVIEQIPPMYSAKKIQGKKLYQLARKGIEIERKPIQVELKLKFLSYTYPFLEIEIDCSKGTYIRSLASDIGKAIGCGGHLSELCRIRSGPFNVENCIPQEELPNLDLNAKLIDNIE